MFYKNKDVYKIEKLKLFFEIIFLFLFYKRILNSIHIILIKFNTILIKSENSFTIINKLKLNNF